MTALNLESRLLHSILPIWKPSASFSRSRRSISLGPLPCLLLSANSRIPPGSFKTFIVNHSIRGEEKVLKINSFPIHAFRLRNDFCFGLQKDSELTPMINYHLKKLGEQERRERIELGFQEASFS